MRACNVGEIKKTKFKLKENDAFAAFFLLICLSVVFVCFAIRKKRNII